MFARIVEFSPTSDAAGQFVQIIQEKALPMVKAQAGCMSAFVVLPRNPGHVVLGVSIWKSNAYAQRYSRECYPDIEKMLRPFLKRDPKLRTFEVREIGNVVLRARATVLLRPPVTRPRRRRAFALLRKAGAESEVIRLRK